MLKDIKALLQLLKNREKYDRKTGWNNKKINYFAEIKTEISEAEESCTN